MINQTYFIRSRCDADALAARLPQAERVVIVGGGYIGLEVAAVLSVIGKQVVLLEASERPLKRVTAESVSRFFEDEHRDRGVRIETGVTVLNLETGSDGLVVGLTDGRFMAADVVVVGIGIDPIIEQLIACGAAASNGVDVDEYCRTNVPGIFAIGDCAAHPNRFAGGARIRLESVQNASDQAKTAASVIAIPFPISLFLGSGRSNTT